MSLTAETYQPVSDDPASEDFQFERWPFYHLARLVNIYHLRLERALKPLGVDVPRWRILTILLDGPTTITRIADKAVSKVSTVAKIVQRMSADGLVETRTSAEDARSTEAMITAAGRAMLAQVRSKVSKISKEAFAGIPPAELEVLVDAARRIHSNLVV